MAPTRGAVRGRSALATPSSVDDADLGREQASNFLLPFGPQRQQRRPARNSLECSSFLSSPEGRRFHAVEVAFERVDVSVPEATERGKPGVDFRERLRSDSIDAALSVDSRLHKAGITQHSEVFGDRGLWHVKFSLYLADGSLRGSEEVQNGATVWFRDDAEGRFHVDIYLLTYIPVSYTHLRAHETPEHLVCRLLLE